MTNADILIALCALAFVACTSAPRPSAVPSGPYVVVLGTAQDAGLPQIGCNDAQCVAARRDPSQRRFASSILLADPRSGSRWLFDAGPDLREQFELARAHPPTRIEVGPRPPLFDGVFLTHAHIGHYAGLMQLGREAYGAHELPVFASPRMNDFLAHNGP
jgi:pyrroloquinoline quinone biosynthesis protein B